MNARMTAGVIAGVVLAVVGPTFLAVGTHSGNASGNDPVDADVEVTLERAADATWAPAGGATRFHFEVVDTTDVVARAGTIDQSAARSQHGEAVARTELCDEHGACIPGTTWRAPLGSPITEGAWLRADPLMQSARFRGWLRVDGHGPACLFTIDWSAAPSEPGVQPSATGTIHPPEQVSLAPGEVPAASTEHLLRLETVRAAAATVTASCWEATGTGDFAGGDGSLSQDVVAFAALDEEAVSTQHLLG